MKSLNIKSIEDAKIKQTNEEISTKNELFEKSKSATNGITLITLIITIVVLLILAGVSIATLTGDNGVLRKVANSKIQQIHGRVSEAIVLAHHEYQLEKSIASNQTFLEYLEKEKEYIDSNGVVNTVKLLGERVSIGNGSGKNDVYIISEEIDNYVLYYYDKEQVYIDLKYIKIGTNESASYITARDLKEGQYIYYTDSLGMRRKCIVLYDSNSEYGIQIVTESTIDTITLGGNSFEEAKDSYNSAITTLNSRAEDYLNDEYATSARCIGSLPNAPDSKSGMYESDEAYMQNYNGTIRDADNNSQIDETQLEKLGIKEINTLYWLASHKVYNDVGYSETYFGLDSIGRGNNILKINSTSESYYDETFGLRAVFTLKPGIKIIDGEGTIDSPYRFSTKKVSKVADLSMGDYVNYTDGNGTSRKCMVLYDRMSSYGVQIITLDTVGNVTLGGEDYETAKDSYNQAITTLNNEARKYMDKNDYASDARCIGTVPNDSDFENEDKFTSDEAFMENYNGEIIDEDRNSEIDNSKMENLNIVTSDKEYWLATRSNYLDSWYSEAKFYLSGYTLLKIDAKKGTPYVVEKGLRPVFILNEDVKVVSGEGTINQPFELGE